MTFYDTGSPGYPWTSQNTDALAAYYVDGGGIQGLLQFSVTTDQQVPCMTFTLLDGLLSKTPTPQLQNNYVINGCFAVGMPTPAYSSSWGSVKAAYR